MTGFETYLLYNSIKLHFNSNYDYFKYNGKSRFNIHSYEKSNGKYQFTKLGNLFNNENDLMLFFVYNFIEDNNTTWIGNLLTDTANNNYLKHKKITDSLSYIFNNECNNILSKYNNPNEILIVNNGTDPILLTAFYRNEISLETLIILDNILGFIINWNKTILDNIVWPIKYKLIIKYRSFMNVDVDEYKKILREVLKENIK
jgi:hypothetical protein